MKDKDKDKEESIHSIFSNQDPASGGYGEQGDTEIESSKKIRTPTAAKTKKKKKNKAAKLSRKKNRR